MRPDERGAVTAFVVVFTIALVLVAGLVIDGGYVLAARRQAINEAEAAARAGAQAVLPDSLHSGGPVMLDPAEARSRALQYLAATGHEGSVSVSGDTVEVDVWFERPTTILGVAGLSSVSVTGKGRARAARGLLEEGQ